MASNRESDTPAQADRRLSPYRAIEAFQDAAGVVFREPSRPWSPSTSEGAGCAPADEGAGCALAQQGGGSSASDGV